ncbi:ABC transporter ATP-binding protein [Sporolactobacillus sp. STCC-11]|uniref:ABC transporter ATP-binding protein n=1 Tax=Sporolactobacillus caesalpiniae TaxID=3230362 RepID=UPI003394A77C
MNYLYNISSGNPKSLLPSIWSSLVEGLLRLMPAILIIDVFNTIYISFANPGTPLNVARLWITSSILLIWLVPQFISSVMAYNRSFLAAYQVSADGRIKLAEHIRKLSLGFLGSKDPAELTNMMLSDYALVEQGVSHHVPQMVSSIVFPILAFAGLLFVNWQMAVAMFIALPLAVLVVWSTDRFQEKLSKNHIEAKNVAASRLQEYLHGIREIKAHNMGGERFERLRRSFEELMRHSIRIEGLMGPILMVAIVLVRSGLPIMIFVGTYLVVNGHVTLPIFLMFLLVGVRVFEPMTVLLTSYGELRYGAFSAKRVMAIMKEAPLSGDREVAAHQAITFDRVTFGYQKDEPVLKNISFSIPANKITALVGPSGSGKSTITKLIARFWDIQSGQIRIGGQSLSEADPEKLLRHVSMVFQDVYLFKDTILNNIRVGKQNATREEIEEAARKAQCHDLIMALPQGYDTMVGEGGSTLSGGEKQRISIARALLKDADIILLDEARPRSILKTNRRFKRRSMHSSLIRPLSLSRTD